MESFLRLVLPLYGAQFYYPAMAKIQDKVIHQQEKLDVIYLALIKEWVRCNVFLVNQ